MKLPKQKTDKLEIAKAQARESAEKNRNLLFGSLLIFAFLILVTLQTTDVDLLLGKAIKLPVIDVNIPLFAFYLLSSPLAFFVHLNLLRNIEAHAVKLKAWKDANRNRPLKPADLFPFIFDFAVVDQESPLAKPTRWLSQLVIYWLGVLTLLLIFWRFTDYQDPLITLIHMAFLVTDLIVLRIIRQRILDILSNNTLEKTEQRKPSRINQWILRFAQVAIFPFGGWTCTTKGKAEWLSQAVGFIAGFITLVHLFLFLAFTLTIFHKYGWSKLSLSFSDQGLLIEIEPFLFFKRNSFNVSDEFLPILIIDQRENLLVFDESLLRLQHELSPNSEESFGEWFMEHGVGLDLRERNLRYAQLENVDLRRAQLTSADLFEAHLEGANLQGANLWDAKLQGADLSVAELQGADLRESNLQGADLKWANLQGAGLGRAKLQGADLRRANLQGARLWRANLQGADLKDAELQGADLNDAELQGADLKDAELQGADLEDANLQGAYLEDAKLQGADLEDANLQGVTLFRANLQGADLEDANLQGADLTDAIMEDIFTNEDTQWTGYDDIDWNELRQLANDINFHGNWLSSANEMKELYIKQLDDAEARIKEGNQERPNLESVSSERLIKTLTETLCSMESVSQKYALKGIVRSYGFYEFLANDDMKDVYNHFKNLQSPLDCQMSS